MNLSFTDEAWQQYISWEDKKIVKRINDLIKDIQRNGSMKGIGKPEVLKYQKKAYSRRITDEHRLTYNIDESGNLLIYSCKGHYKDK